MEAQVNLCDNCTTLEGEDYPEEIGRHKCDVCGGHFCGDARRNNDGSYAKTPHCEVSKVTMFGVSLVACHGCMVAVAKAVDPSASYDHDRANAVAADLKEQLACLDPAVEAIMTNRLKQLKAS